MPLVLEDAGTEAELQALRIRYGGDIRSQRLGGEAKVAEFEGRAAKGAAFTRAGASLLEAGKTFAGGYDTLFPKGKVGAQKMTPTGGPFSRDRFTGAKQPDRKYPGYSYRRKG